MKQQPMITEVDIRWDVLMTQLLIVSPHCPKPMTAGSYKMAMDSGMISINI